MRYPVVSPREFLGHDVCADYTIAGYDKLREYWALLASGSPSARVAEIGTTSQGRPHAILVLSSPPNIDRLDAILADAHAIAYPDASNPEASIRTAAGATPVIYLDGGVHTSEVIPSEALFEIAYLLASQSDDAIASALDDVVVVLAHGNPDGHQYAADNYMREADPSRRPSELRFALPDMIPSYSGADNNRDFLLCRLPETRNLNGLLYRDFCPQIVYDPHQTGPLGVAMYLPPYKEPLVPEADPLIMTLINELGLFLHNRLILEGKAGTYYGAAAEYQHWLFGMLPSPLHNVLAFHSEVIGTPQPQRVPLVIDKQLPQMSLPRPLRSGMWHARTSLEYQVSAHLGVVDWAWRNRARLLQSVCKANLDAIAAGRRDNWTVHAERIDALATAARQCHRPPYDRADRAAGVTTGNLRGGVDVPAHLQDCILTDRSYRDPRAFIIAVEQPAAEAVFDFCDALVSNGVTLRRTTEPFLLGGEEYPEGAIVVTTDQSKRAHILHVFEPQYYPTGLALAEGDSAALYGAGHTLALQMGFRFGRILDDRLPASVPADGALCPAGSLDGTGEEGFLVPHSDIRGVRFVTAALKAGHAVSWLVEERPHVPASSDKGAFFISPSAASLLSDHMGREGFDAVRSGWVSENAFELRLPRIAVFDVFGGLANAGWIRWLLDRYGFAHQTVYASHINAGDRLSDVDVLVLPDGLAPTGYHEPKPGEVFPQPPIDEIESQYLDRIGTIDAGAVAQLRGFLSRGGRIISIGAGQNLLGLLTDAIRIRYLKPKTSGDSDDEPILLRKSVMAAYVDREHMLGHGCESVVKPVVSGRVFDLANERAQCVVRFGDEPELLSGLAIGSKALAGGSLMAVEACDTGSIVAFSFDPVHRGQSAGTFMLLVNAILAWQPCFLGSKA